MNSIQFLSLRAVTILSEEQVTLDQLASKLCIGKRHVYRVINHLKISGFSISARRNKREKYFWVSSNAEVLPAILSSSEQIALKEAIQNQNTNLKTAVYKLIQMAHMRFRITIQK